MTHEELLTKLSHEITDYFALNYKHNNYYKALRAVVELHKPNKYGWCSHCAEDECWGCHTWGSDDNCGCMPKYPCPTIQAIEKELA